MHWHPMHLTKNDVDTNWEVREKTKLHYFSQFCGRFSIPSRSVPAVCVVEEMRSVMKRCNFEIVIMLRLSLRCGKRRTFKKYIVFLLSS